MKELKTKTPSGKEIILNETGYCIKQYVKQLNGIHVIVKQDGVHYAIAKDKEKEVENFYYEIIKEKSNAKLTELNSRIPGYSELQAAYEYRIDQITINNNYMERGFKTSIFSGDSGKVEEAEAKVKELEEKYPIAKHYIKWNNANPTSSSGFAANKAAEALFNGKTMEEAAKIADDWDRFD